MTEVIRSGDLAGYTAEEGQRHIVVYVAVGLYSSLCTSALLLTLAPLNVLEAPRSA